jgi:signal transduction histidine kinase
LKNKSNKIKLLKKVSQKQLQFGLVIVVLSLICLYFLTRYYIISETKEGLNNTSFRIEQKLIKNESPKSLYPLFEVKEVRELKPQVLKDTIIFDELQGENELFKELNAYKSINGKNYHIITRALIVEYDDTLLSILISFAIIISLVYAAQYYFNKKINKTVWNPFFKNLDAIKSFSIQSNTSIDLADSDIQEFIELNSHLKSLTEKVVKDYQNLKQFTEDVSHEAQTPLSIIQAKIENLTNDTEHLTIDHLSALNDIQKNAKRLSKLNKGLILLTKIDNQQFNNPEIVNVNDTVASLIEDVEDLSNIKHQTVTFTEDSNVEVNMDKVLGEILFSNLIGNAIKHTPENGHINFLIKENAFSICNSGTAFSINSTQLFKRFLKTDPKSPSLGLGLAIVKKICDFYNFTITYEYQQRMHCYTILFSLKEISKN